MGLYNTFTGSGNQVPKGPCMAEALEVQLKGSQRPLGPAMQSRETEPIELEQTFNGVYKNYRINGRPRMDVETFFHRIRGELIDLFK